MGVGLREEIVEMLYDFVCVGAFCVCSRCTSPRRTS